MSDKRYLRRAIGPGFARDANYIIDTIEDMINRMQEKVGKDYNREKAVFLIGPVLLRTLKWAAPTQYKCIKVIEDSHQYNNRQQIILEYEEKKIMTNYYHLKRDFRSMIHSGVFHSIHILSELDIMLKEMDDYVRNRYYLKSARRRYQLRMGIGLYHKLKDTVWNGSGFVSTYKDIPLILNYDKDEEYIIELKFEEEKTMPPFERTIFEPEPKLYQKFFTPIQTFEVKPKKVIFSGPCTIVIWSDKTKTMVRRAAGELDDPEKALALCLLKKNKELFKLCRKEAENEQSKRGVDTKKEVFFDDRK